MPPPSNLDKRLPVSPPPRDAPPNNAAIGSAAGAAGAGAAMPAPPRRLSKPAIGSAAGSGAGAGAAAAYPKPPPSRAAKGSSSSSAAGAGAAAAACWAYALAKSCLSWSIPGAAGGGGGGGGGAGASSNLGSEIAPIGLERSTTLFKVLMAFSRMGSTWWRIPSLLSKSWICGIILERDCILEKTLTSGWVSSSLVKIFLVNAFWMLLTAFFFAWAALTGACWVYICPIVFWSAAIRLASWDST